MRRWLLFVYLFLLASTVDASPLRGTWHLSNDDRRVQLELSYDQSHYGHTMSIEEFRGLSAADLNTSTEAPAKFQLVREAGTFDFSGTFAGGDGVGRFNFTPDPSYTSRLRSLGVSSDELTDERLFSLAVIDVSSAFIREMQSLGYRESLDRYVAFRIHGATPDFVRQMQSLGYNNLSSDRIVAFRIHGVTPDYVRELKASGYENIESDQLIAFRIHGVTPQFAKDLRDMGVRDLSADRLVAMRIHGVTSDFVRELRDLGYRNLSSDQLVAMRIHGVSTQFIRELANAGYHDVPVEKLVEMRIHGIDADFVRKVK